MRAKRPHPSRVRPRRRRSRVCSKPASSAEPHCRCWHQNPQRTRHSPAVATAKPSSEEGNRQTVLVPPEKSGTMTKTNTDERQRLIRIHLEQPGPAETVDSFAGTGDCYSLRYRRREPQD
jgi:hypothetical protein